MTTDHSKAAAENAGDLVDRIREHYDAGLGRNAIAKAVGASTWKVSQICKANGWNFDQERTRRAVEVHVASAGDQRRKLASRFRNLADIALTGAESTTDPDEMFKYAKVAAVSVDKDDVLDQIDHRSRHASDMAGAMQQFTAFGALVRGAAAAARDRDEPP
ncbi:MAG: hypothetical protein LKG15_00420 [Corynebacterium provencense]|jgi:plasmid replication initiation protein|uniref:hypothetical protein n=1 Tax=Corynebacterium provencense TaxID=1737425 RepID=UPI002989E46F|nr:hypothetical protein [Corynebacterium provencense]